MLVTATDTSTINADGAGFGVALRFGEKKGIDAAIGIGVAINDIGGVSTNVERPTATVFGAGQSLAGGTLIVSSVDGFENSGTFTVAGGTGTCSYLAKNATTKRFTGITGCSGTPDAGAAVTGPAVAL